MKNLKQIILPAVIVLMGTGAAFATNQAKKENAANKMGCSPLLDENDYFLPILNSSLDIVAKNF